MKKLFLSICLLLLSNVLLAQTFTFEVDNIKYTTTSESTVTVTGNSITSLTDVVIDETVTFNGKTYTVTAIGYRAFKSDNPSTTIRDGYLRSIVIPNTVTNIGQYAFHYQELLTSATIPNSVTVIDDYAFSYCVGLESVNLGNNLSEIGKYAFNYCKSLTSITIPSSVTSIGEYAFYNTTNLALVTCFATTAPTLGGSCFFKGYDSDAVKRTLIVPFGSDYSDWEENVGTSLLKIYYKINEGETKVLSTVFEVTNKREIDNGGVLRIAQGGELIGAVSGIVEVVTPELATNKWHIIGAPFANYKLETLIPGELDPTCLLFDYNNNDWSNTWAHISNPVATGEGFYAFPWNDEAYEALSFTNYGDGIHSPNARDEFSNYNYDYDATPTYQINTEDVDVEETLVESSETGYWMALANPYTFKLDVGTFLNDQQNIQGGVLYKLENESWTTTSDVINVTEGFFVNFVNGGNKTAHFKTTQRATNAKASVEREFISLVMIDQEREIEVLFAQNEEAQEGYDRFDANKLFSPYEIAEPYFVTNNIALVKEEVNTLPYYATMNVRSFENKEVKFKANYIPEGYAVSLIDGEETIDLLQGQEYATEISAGENANRFKVLIKKSVGLGEVEELEVEITNSNRLVNVSSTEEDLQIEVYNALGQKVFATKDRNFTLNNVSAGAYMIKAFNNKASKTQKIVVK